MMELTQELLEAATAAAAKYDVPLPVILGVTEQESAGNIFAEVHGRLEPYLRHEGHYLYRRLSGAFRDRAVREKLAASKAGAIKNPSTQHARWDKLVLPAMEIDRAAEIESCSWGVGQVMGAHWKALDFDSAEDFLTHVRSGVEGQIDVMMRFCKANNLLDEMRRKDFDAFAYGYNGPGNVGVYGPAIARKVAAWEKQFPANPAPVGRPVLRKGSKGPAVKELQQLLNEVDGASLLVDGDFGKATGKAVESFQATAGLSVDGIVGEATWAALEARRGQ